MKEKYKIEVDGCDDTTELEIELSDFEYLFVKDLAKKITAASTCGCQPRMSISKID